MDAAPDEAPKSDPKPAPGKPAFTTFRVSQSAGQDMSDLAGLTGRSTASLYDEFCAPIIRALLEKKMEERLREIRSGAPEGPRQ